MTKTRTNPSAHQSVLMDRVVGADKITQLSCAFRYIPTLHTRTKKGHNSFLPQLGNKGLVHASSPLHISTPTPGSPAFSSIIHAFALPFLVSFPSDKALPLLHKKTKHDNGSVWYQSTPILKCTPRFRPGVRITRPRREFKASTVFLHKCEHERLPAFFLGTTNKSKKKRTKRAQVLNSRFCLNSNSACTKESTKALRRRCKDFNILSPFVVYAVFPITCGGILNCATRRVSRLHFLFFFFFKQEISDSIPPIPPPPSRTRFRPLAWPVATMPW